MCDQKNVTNTIRLVKLAVREQWRMGERGNLFLDAPKQLTFGQFCELAKDRNKWKELTRTRIRSKVVTAPNSATTRNQRRSCRTANTDYNEDKLTDRCMAQPTPKPTSSITLSSRAPAFVPTLPSGLTKTRLSANEREKKLCRDREIHEAFFLLGYVPPKTN